jgi:hypothetical protein
MDALGGANGGAEGDRTLDLRIANATLSQLSYRPTYSHGSPQPRVARVPKERAILAFVPRIATLNGYDARASFSQ